MVRLFQCPDGHSLFFHTTTSMRSTSLTTKFQCPYGHSLFFHRRSTSGATRHTTNSFQCPYGHSLFFHRRRRQPQRRRRQPRFNALTGILCFSTGESNGIPVEVFRVSMPLRAFFVFPRRTQCLICCPRSSGWVSMPLRAFFVFPRSRPRQWDQCACRCFNALTGILCFSTHRAQSVPCRETQFQCPYGHSLFFHRLALTGIVELNYSFNALTGILCFSTRRMT